MTLTDSGDTFTEYDSRGLPVRSKVPGLGIGDETPHLFTEQIYDWAGRPVLTSQEHLPSETPAWTTSTYDDRGRLQLVESPQGRFQYRHASQRQYEDQFPEWGMNDGIALTHITDAEGLERVAVVDYKGQTVLSADGVGIAQGNTGYVSKTILGAWDLPTRLIDPELNETESRYTDDGLLASTEDLDRGRIERTYDEFGNLVKEIAADGIESVFTYDDIDRLRTRVDKLPDGDQLSEWQYDLDVPGTLSVATGPTGIRTNFEYEDTPRALLRSQRTSIDGGMSIIDYEHDALGRVSRVIYPGIGVDGENFLFATRPVYDAHSGGQVAVLSDDEVTQYWGVEDIDHATQNVTVRFGNGVLEERSYNSVTRRLESIQTLDASGDVLGELGYQHYANGQILQRTFSHDGDTHIREFFYDRAGRLETVIDDGDDETFGFSPSGRLTSRSKFGAYTYDVVQPHAVSLIGENEFTYDVRGNQAVRRGPDIVGGWQTTTSFSRFNLPERVEVGDPDAPDEVLSYEYGADGSRVLKTNEIANVQVFTNGELFERTLGPGGLPSALYKFRVFVGGSEVLQVQYDSSDGEFGYSYLHRDRLGSVVFTTDQEGTRSEPRDFDAFGAPLSNPEWASSITESYTGHLADGGLGLLQAGARMYDSKFGVFTTPDPLRVSGAGSQGFNPYAYANNDPINWFDPTGFQADPTDWEWPEEVEHDEGVNDPEFEDPEKIEEFLDEREQAQPPAPPNPSEVGLGIDGNSMDAAPAMANYYGRGSFQNMNIGLTRNLDRAGESYETWNTIGVYGTLALNVVNLAVLGRGLFATAGRYLGLGAATKGAGVLVRHGPLNPGPLPQAIANTFRGGSYTANTVEKATTLYRAYGGKAGQLGGYWTRTKPSGPVQSIVDSALKPQWGNTATNVATIRVPAGTTIYEGAAAAQGGLVGGGSQVFIPNVNAAWLIP